MPSERRIFARLYVGVEANYVQEGLGKSGTKVLVQDISISGVRFISSEKLTENSLLAFTLNTPDIPVKIEAAGKVVWQKKFSESFYDTGIEFVKMDSDLKQALSDYIKKSLGRVEEHRNFVRSNISTMVKYKIKNSELDENQCLSVDISSTGLKVFVKKELEKDTQILMSFNLPDDTDPIIAEGKIIWTKRREEKFYEEGIEFTNISENHVKKIEQYVKKTLGIDW